VHASLEKILVRGVNWLGDAVMSLPAIQALIEAYPDRVDILTQKKLEPLYEHVPGLNRILSFAPMQGWRGIQERFRLAQRLKKENYSTCLVFPNSFDAALVPGIARIPRIVGFNRNARGFFLTDKIPPPKNYFSVHHSMHYKKIVGFFLNRELSAPHRIPFLTLSEEKKRETLEYFEKTFPIPKNAVFFGLSPGSEYGPAKKWHLDRYRALCEKILEWENAIVLIFGTTKDQADVSFLRRDDPRIVDLTGKTDLRQLIALLSCCRGLLTNDSGGMHLAGALGIPVAAIFGSTWPEATRGLGPGDVFYHRVSCAPCFERVCPGRGMICMDAVTVDEVWEKVKLWNPKSL
jgi:heptosyltransferase-2